MQLIYLRYHKFNKSFMKWLLIPYIMLSLSLVSQAALEIVETSKKASKISTYLSDTKTLKLTDGGEAQRILNIRKTIFKRKVRQATEPLRLMQESFNNEIQRTNPASERNSDAPLWKNAHRNRFYNKEYNYNTDYDNYDLQQNLAESQEEVYPIKQRQQEQQTALLSLDTTTSESTHASFLRQLKILWEFHQACMTIWNAIVEYKQKLAPELATSDLAPNEQSTTEIKVKRAINDESKTISAARYTKNDPLKSYYDFIIMEASHKFWSVFEVITAVIVIYSTFTAIYFSKMNPLVSKYDYTDYLGSENYIGPPVIEVVKPEEARDADDEVEADLDFIDVDDANDDDEHTTYWLHWLPNTSHSVKFILDAIDKLPVDRGRDLE